MIILEMGMLCHDCDHRKVWAVHVDKNTQEAYLNGVREVMEVVANHQHEHKLYVDLNHAPYHPNEIIPS